MRGSPAELPGILLYVTIPDTLIEPCRIQKSPNEGKGVDDEDVFVDGLWRCRRVGRTGHKCDVLKICKTVETRPHHG